MQSPRTNLLQVTEKLLAMESEKSTLIIENARLNRDLADVRKALQRASTSTPHTDLDASVQGVIEENGACVLGRVLGGGGCLCVVGVSGVSSRRACECL